MVFPWIPTSSIHKLAMFCCGQHSAERRFSGSGGDHERLPLASPGPRGPRGPGGPGGRKALEAQPKMPEFLRTDELTYELTYFDQIFFFGLIQVRKLTAFDGTQFGAFNLTESKHGPERLEFLDGSVDVKLLARRPIKSTTELLAADSIHLPLNLVSQKMANVLA